MKGEAIEGKLMGKKGREWETCRRRESANCRKGVEAMNREGRERRGHKGEMERRKGMDMMEKA